MLICAIYLETWIQSDFVTQNDSKILTLVYLQVTYNLVTSAQVTMIWVILTIFQEILYYLSFQDCDLWVTLTSFLVTFHVVVTNSLETCLLVILSVLLEILETMLLEIYACMDSQIYFSFLFFYHQFFFSCHHCNRYCLVIDREPTNHTNYNPKHVNICHCGLVANRVFLLLRATKKH